MPEYYRTLMCDGNSDCPNWHKKVKVHAKLVYFVSEDGSVIQVFETVQYRCLCNGGELLIITEESNY